MKFIFCLFLFSASIGAQEQRKIVFRYKKYEKFQFDNLTVKGDSVAPADITIDARSGLEFKNRLPQRPDFNDRIREAAISVR